MFERFTNKARHVVVLAQEEARRLQHNYIGTEHVLLGLLGESSGLAFRVLEGFGMSLEGAREEVKALVGTGTGTVSGHIPFTPRAKKIPSSRSARPCNCTTTTSAPSTSCSE
jgi:ATP-dependent Clp protease ATP-binding subunit ClpC